MHQPVGLVRRTGGSCRSSQRARLTRGRLYLDVGTSEGAGDLRDARTLNRVLRRKGYQQDASVTSKPRGTSTAKPDWAWRLPQALEFLLREAVIFRP